MKANDVKLLIGPIILLFIGVICGFIPSNVDGTTLAAVPNITWFLLNICLTCYALGMIHGRLTANMQRPTKKGRK